MSDGFHPPLEEYLEAVHELEEEGTQIIQARLAERLGHAAPTVSEMIKRLRDDGYLVVEGREISLTEKGRTRAESVVRKHRLAERLLTDVIGLEWHKAHNEACRWEHVISDDVEAKLVTLLDNPVTCPHGNPIPGAGGVFNDLTPLSTATEGQRVRLERVTEQVEINYEALAYLGTNNFRPGTEAVVRERQADGTLTLEYAGTTISLGPAVTDHLLIAAG